MEAKEVNSDFKATVQTQFANILTGAMFVWWAAENLTEDQANTMIETIKVQCLESLSRQMPYIDDDAKAICIGAVDEVVTMYRDGLRTMYSGAPKNRGGRKVEFDVMMDAATMEIPKDAR